ncbi:hypothetical protein JQ596_21305 [Bradyrhizobium manausense]|uniref:hypothetical protein n=1 Tax=Bradyrhizobium TaxID=374 RepID=UPI001BA84128|nr:MULTISPECIES: hypothetical protein [Bradyrhizobium]MBR0828076.1 hypothetical protein [Bradyrhizobium manausense]UVO32936.1 hypothetical protein KUF59_21110 [Bradyrhizobium arachidis]
MLSQLHLQATMMSQYVEARYALLTLQEARETSEGRATKLLNNLLQDLRPTQQDDPHRADAIASIQHLAVILRQHRMPPSSYWEAAFEATHAWRDHAEQ